MTKPTFTIEEQHDMARRDFPVEYAAAQALTGKRKSNRFRSLRDRVVFAAQMLALPKDAFCSNCQHCGTYPAGLNPPRCCDLRSDFYGYAIVLPNDVCPDWQAAA